VDLRRLSLNVREFVTQLEQSVIQLLASYDVCGSARSDAPGVYVKGAKIASLGLRVRRGCSFHGVAININLDLQPFDYINPCGYRGMTMVRLADLTSQPVTAAGVAVQYAKVLASRLGFSLDMVSTLPAWAVLDQNR
ncbi:MAG: lipoyl(octanoyl) transferase LipB, partial [Cellvibrionaceae bacterium]|nr:lipoyl(octanoyl) transferase LipB [Cellvibrionaceae bacterium]